MNVGCVPKKVKRLFLNMLLQLFNELLCMFFVLAWGKVNLVDITSTKLLKIEPWALFAFCAYDLADQRGNCTRS